MLGEGNHESLSVMQPTSRTFEDVIFGAILGAWSVTVPKLWAPEVPLGRSLRFLLGAAILALTLRLLFLPRRLLVRLLCLGWAVIIIGTVSYSAVVAGIFLLKEGAVFGLVFFVWSLAVLGGEGASWLILRWRQ